MLSTVVSMDSIEFIPCPENKATFLSEQFGFRETYFTDKNGQDVCQGNRVRFSIDGEAFPYEGFIERGDVVNKSGDLVISSFDLLSQKWVKRKVI